LFGIPRFALAHNMPTKREVCAKQRTSLLVPSPSMNL